MLKEKLLVFVLISSQMLAQRAAEDEELEAKMRKNLERDWKRQSSKEDGK